jgi:hypothetical protein
MSSSFRVHSKRVTVSKTGDEKDFAHFVQRPCKASGDHRPELLAPIFEFVKSVVLDSSSPGRFIYEDADSAAFRPVFTPHTQTVVLDPRSELGRLTVQLGTEIVHYCVRVKEDDQEIQINLEIVDISVS